MTKDAERLSNHVGCAPSGRAPRGGEAATDAVAGRRPATHSLQKHGEKDRSRPPGASGEPRSLALARMLATHRLLYAEQAQYHGLQAVDTRRHSGKDSTDYSTTGYSTEYKQKRFIR
jgi:hypothetical protein